MQVALVYNRICASVLGGIYASCLGCICKLPWVYQVGCSIFGVKIVLVYLVYFVSYHPKQLGAYILLPWVHEVGELPWAIISTKGCLGQLYAPTHPRQLGTPNSVHPRNLVHPRHLVEQLRAPKATECMHQVALGDKTQSTPSTPRQFLHQRWNTQLGTPKATYICTQGNLHICPQGHLHIFCCTPRQLAYSILLGCTKLPWVHITWLCIELSWLICVRVQDY